MVDFHLEEVMRTTSMRTKRCDLHRHTCQGIDERSHSSRQATVQHMQEKDMQETLRKLG